MIGNVCTVALKSLNCPVSSIPCAASAYFDSPKLKSSNTELSYSKSSKRE